LGAAWSPDRAYRAAPGAFDFSRTGFPHRDVEIGVHISGLGVGLARLRGADAVAELA
jgi:hypothetical protein